MANWQLQTGRIIFRVWDLDPGLVSNLFTSFDLIISTVAGGLLSARAPDTFMNRNYFYAARGALAFGWFSSERVRHVTPSDDQGGRYGGPNMWTGNPLVIAGRAQDGGGELAAANWAASTASIGTTKIRFIVDYSYIDLS